MSTHLLTRWRVATALTVIVIGALTACTPTTTPSGARAVTTEESQVLATVRFHNFDTGARGFTTSLRDAGTDLALVGWVDFTTGVGLATLSESGTPSYLLVWNATTVAAKPINADEAAAVSTPPVRTPTDSSNFSSSPLGTDGALHPLLSILIALGNDRPDNPLLVQQGGALWLRDDTVGSTAVTVFAGPTTADGSTDTTTQATVDPEASSTRYWVDADGLLQRFDVRLGADWVTIDFGTATDVQLDDPFQ
jgi:hypothetical protein